MEDLPETFVFVLLYMSIQYNSIRIIVDCIVIAHIFLLMFFFLVLTSAILIIVMLFGPDAK